MTIDELIRSRKILVTAGTGGVGKTTLSAAIGLRAAILGKRAVVVTVDPAKRLATSLGIEELGDRPSDLTARLRDSLQRSGTSASGLGSFSAVIPDTRRTFEEFVLSLTKDREEAEKIFRNPIFQIFAKEYSGSNEYMALQRLHSLNLDSQFDFIVLDTPPSRNTLSFLDAPQLLARFFEDRLINLIVIPTNRLVSGGLRKALGILERLTGAGFMTALFDFTSSLFAVRENFTRNLHAVTGLLESSEVGFLLVAVPSPEHVGEISHFITALRDHRFRFDGMVLNRSLSELDPGDWSKSSTPGRLTAKEIWENIRGREQRVFAELRTEASAALARQQLRPGHSENAPLFMRLPELARDVHSVEDLLHVAGILGQPRTFITDGERG